MSGKSIRIFLIDGTASGLRTAEIGLSTTKAFVVPRASLSAAAKRIEVQRTGVYVLVGADPVKPGLRKIYVGEGDVLWTRLSAHNKDTDKDFWDEAVVFVSKDENLTKAHVRYVEARLIALARDAKRCTVANGTDPSEQGKLPEADVHEMEEFIAQARLLLGTLGYDLFEPAPAFPVAVSTGVASATALPEFVFSGANFSASCLVDLDAGQFIVKSGSKARVQETPSLSGTTYSNLRAQLLANGVLEKKDDRLVFTQDYGFSSSSAAASVVSGQTISGTLAWKSKDSNQTFGQWQEAQAANDEKSAPDAGCSGT